MAQVRPQSRTGRIRATEAVSPVALLYLNHGSIIQTKEEFHWHYPSFSRARYYILYLVEIEHVASTFLRWLLFNTTVAYVDPLTIFFILEREAKTQRTATIIIK